MHQPLLEIGSSGRSSPHTRSLRKFSVSRNGFMYAGFASLLRFSNRILRTTWILGQRYLDSVSKRRLPFVRFVQETWLYIRLYIRESEVCSFILLK